MGYFQDHLYLLFGQAELLSRGFMWPARPRHFGATGRVATNDAKGLCIAAQSHRSLGPGRGGGAFLAGSCPKFKGALELHERSRLAERENRLPSFRGRRRNTNIFKRL